MLAAASVSALGGLLSVPLGGEVEGAGILLTVGEVSAHSAVVWARPPGPGPVAVTFAPAGSGAGAARTQAEAGAAADFTVKLPLTGLAPATRYDYRVSWGNQEIDGAFVTAPAPDTARPLTLLWSGDLGGGGRCRSPASGYPIFRAMAARRPDLFVFVGDTIYADHRCPAPENVPGSDFHAADLDGFRTKHRYNRADPAVQAFLRTTAVFAIWDDHEVRNDFGGPAEPLMPIGRRAFLDYWPIVPPPEDPYRLYRRVRWGRLGELFILDTRQYRSPNALPDGAAKTMLGAAQREWLLAGLRESDAVWKLVVTSVPLSIPTGRAGARDSWAGGGGRTGVERGLPGFEHELMTIVRELAARGVGNVVWLAADVHRAEVLRHTPLPGVVFHELVAGPLSASTGHPGRLADRLRPTRLYAEGGFSNFGELSVGESELEVRIIDAEGRVRHVSTLVARP